MTLDSTRWWELWVFIWWLVPAIDASEHEWLEFIVQISCCHSTIHCSFWQDMFNYNSNAKPAFQQEWCQYYAVTGTKNYSISADYSLRCIGHDDVTAWDIVCFTGHLYGETTGHWGQVMSTFDDVCCQSEQAFHQKVEFRGDWCYCNVTAIDFWTLLLTIYL